MLITDSPYAAGTPEHGDWVRNVFIPAVEAERAKIDRWLRGAASIGGSLIHGSRINPHEPSDPSDLARLFVDLSCRRAA